MFESNPESDKKRDCLVELFLRYGRGSTVPIAEIEDAIGMPYDVSNPLGYVVSRRSRKLLLDKHGIATIEIPGVGVKVCTQSEQVIECTSRRERKARRQIRKGIREVSKSNPAELDHNTAAFRARSLMFMRSQAKAMRQSKVRLGLTAEEQEAIDKRIQDARERMALQRV